MLFETPKEDESVYISRGDVNELLSSFSRHGFELDGAHWPSVEHYFQGMKFEDPADRESVRLAQHPKKARRMGRSRFRKLRKDWHKLRRVIMTRAIYTKCRTHPEVAQRLLETGELVLVESSQYDYFWGCGRDRRGHNTYGAVLMDVREKLREEMAGDQSDSSSQRS
ncbi:MAG: NADAR family protein [Halieaceae bacterium]